LISTSRHEIRLSFSRDLKIVIMRGCSQRKRERYEAVDDKRDEEEEKILSR
jgi:hypothetical protein